MAWIMNKIGKDMPLFSIGEVKITSVIIATQMQV